ncbi:MAG: hypothetical protein IRZ33_10075 [Alicyclobacillaceae bacterium]|nr:hypothetical protein [Alicyclobacillaceae bacterium]
MEGPVDIRIVGREEIRKPHTLPCPHGCEHVIQIVNVHTDEVECELCEMEAEHRVGLLLEAIEECGIRRPDT